MGKIEPSEFMRFADCLDAVVIEIATGDTEKLDKDEHIMTLKAQYFLELGRREPYYNIFNRCFFFCFEIEESTSLAGIVFEVDRGL